MNAGLDKRDVRKLSLTRAFGLAIGLGLNASSSTGPWAFEQQQTLTRSRCAGSGVLLLVFMSAKPFARQSGSRPNRRLPCRSMIEVSYAHSSLPHSRQNLCRPRRRIAQMRPIERGLRPSLSISRSMI